MTDLDFGFFTTESSKRLSPFFSSPILNLIVATVITLIHGALVAFLGARGKSFKSGMMRGRFTATLTFTVWCWFYVPTLSATITVFARGGEVDLPFMPYIVVSVITLIFMGVLGAHAAIIIKSFSARAVKCDAKTFKTHWLTTPSQMWGDRAGAEG